MLRGRIEVTPLSYRIAHSSLAHLPSLHLYVLIMGILSQDLGIQAFCPDSPKKLICFSYMNQHLSKTIFQCSPFIDFMKKEDLVQTLCGITESTLQQHHEAVKKKKIEC